MVGQKFSNANICIQLQIRRDDREQAKRNDSANSNWQRRSTIIKGNKVLHRGGGGTTSAREKRDTPNRLSLLHRPWICAIFQQPSGVELGPIFEN